MLELLEVNKDGRQDERRKNAKEDVERKGGMNVPSDEIVLDAGMQKFVLRRNNMNAHEKAWHALLNFARNFS